MRKFLVAIGVIVVALASAAFIGPRFVDWSRYKGEIAARIQDATGRALAIDGPISFELLPSPRLSIADARLANLPGASTPDMVRLKSLDLKLSLWPLLGGKIRVESLVLNAPAIALERFKDGRVNWRFTPEVARSAGNSVNLTGVALGGSLGRPRVDRIEISNGTLVYRDDESGARVELDRVSGTLLAPQDAPVELHGRGLYRDLPIAFDATLERGFWTSGADAAPAGLDVKIAAAGTTLSLDGGLARADGNYAFTGRLKLAGADLAASARGLGLDGVQHFPAFFDQAFSVEGDAKWAKGAFALTDASVGLGDSEASGSLEMTPPKDAGRTRRIDAKLAFERLDLSEGPKQAGTSAPSSPVAASNVAPAPSAASSGTAALFAFPKDIEFHLDARATALLYRGAPIRGAQLSLALVRGQLQLEKATAELPGDSDATIYGALRRDASGAPSFAGNLVLDSDNLRDLMGWLGIDAGGVPAERLRRLSVNATLDATPGRLEIKTLDGTIDASHLRGGGVIVFGARPAYGISLDLDRLNLDAYLPSDATAPGAAAPATAPRTSPTAASGTSATTASSFDPLTDADGNLHARIDELIYRGQDIRGLDADGTLQGGNLALRDAHVDDLAGVAADVKGSLAGFGDAPKLDLLLDARASDLTAFFRFLDVKSPVAPATLGATSLKGHVAGGLAGLDVDLAGNVARADWTLKGKIGLDGGVGGGRGLGYDLDVGAKGQGWGGFDLHAKAQGNPTTVTLADLGGTVDGVGVSGSLQVGFAGPRPKLTAELAADRLDLDRIFAGNAPAATPGAQAASPAATPPSQPWSTAPIRFLPLEAADGDLALSAREVDYASLKISGAKLDAALANGTLTLKSLTGKLFGGDLKIAGKVDDAAGPGGNLSLELANADLGAAGFKLGMLRLSNGTLDAKAALAASGLTPAALVRSLTGTASFRLANGTLDGFELDAVGKRLDRPAGLVSVLGLVQTALAGGSTKVKSLSGTLKLADGVARNDDLALDAEGGRVAGRGTIDLARWSVDYLASIQIEGAPEAPPFTVTLKGALDDPRKIVNVNALQDYMLKRLAAARKAQAPAPQPAPAQNGASAKP